MTKCICLSEIFLVILHVMCSPRSLFRSTRKPVDEKWVTKDWANQSERHFHWTLRYKDMTFKLSKLAFYLQPDHTWGTIAFNSGIVQNCNAKYVTSVFEIQKVFCQPSCMYVSLFMRVTILYMIYSQHPQAKPVVSAVLCCYRTYAFCIPEVCALI